MTKEKMSQKYFDNRQYGYYMITIWAAFSQKPRIKIPKKYVSDLEVKMIAEDNNVDISSAKYFYEISYIYGVDSLKEIKDFERLFNYFSKLNDKTKGLVFCYIVDKVK